MGRKIVFVEDTYSGIRKEDSGMRLKTPPISDVELLKSLRVGLEGWKRGLSQDLACSVEWVISILECRVC